MLLGCLQSGFSILIVNYIFVANLTPESATVVFQVLRFHRPQGRSRHEQVTLGASGDGRLLGPEAAGAMNLMMLVLFISAMSAMTMVGPRVYAAMARDGFLPKWLAGHEGLRRAEPRVARRPRVGRALHPWFARGTFKCRCDFSALCGAHRFGSLRSISARAIGCSTALNGEFDRRGRLRTFCRAHAVLWV